MPRKRKSAIGPIPPAPPAPSAPSSPAAPQDPRQAVLNFIERACASDPEPNLTMEEILKRWMLKHPGLFQWVLEMRYGSPKYYFDSMNLWNQPTQVKIIIEEIGGKK